MTFSVARHGAAADDTASGASERNRILIVDSNRSQAGQLASQLEAYGYATLLCTAETWMETPAGELEAVVIGPSALPLEVAELCRRIRARTESPLIAFMGTWGADHMSLVLDAGADHCFVAEMETSARLVISGIGAVQRREEALSEKGEKIIAVGRMRIDLDRRVVELDGALVPLTTTEFNMLALLAQNPGRVMSASEILQQVHGYRVADDEAQDIVKVHISRLRQKLAVDGVPGSALLNVRGQGYMYMLERRGETREMSGAESRSASPGRRFARPALDVSA